MARFPTYESVVPDDELPVPKDPVTHVRTRVLDHASQLKNLLDEMEERISVLSQELAAHTKARDYIFEALRGTEKLRVQLKEDNDYEPAEPVTDRPSKEAF